MSDTECIIALMGALFIWLLLLLTCLMEIERHLRALRSLLIAPTPDQEKAKTDVE